MLNNPARLLTFTIAGVIFAACCIAPLFWMLVGSGRADTLSFAALFNERQRGLMANTVAIGVGTVSVSAIIGVPLGIMLGRCAPGRVWLPRLLLVIPVVVPSYVSALAWMVVFGGSTAAYGVLPTLLVLGFTLFPLIMLATEASLRNIPSRLQEAAWLAASPTRVWRRVVLPLMMPPLIASTLLVFVIAISDFAVPSLLRSRVYTTEVFTAFASYYDFNMATVAAMPLILMATTAAVAALAFARHPSVVRNERAPAGAVWPARAQQAAATLTGLLGTIAIAALISILLFESTAARAPLTAVLSMSAVQNSIVWSGAAASLIALIGGTLGYWRARTAWRAARLTDALSAALFAVPSTVLGVGIIALWNRPGFMGAVYRSDAIVTIAYLGRFLPIGFLLCAAFLQRIPIGVEEAAATSGASWARTLRRIVLPMASKSLAAVWLIVFVLALGDVALAILLAPPGESTLPVRAYTLIANSPAPDVARLALVQLIATVLPVAGIAALFRGRSAIT